VFGFLNGTLHIVPHSIIFTAVSRAFAALSEAN
jgi:hypothetical protein